MTAVVDLDPSFDPFRPDNLAAPYPFYESPARNRTGAVSAVAQGVPGHHARGGRYRAARLPHVLVGGRCGLSDMHGLPGWRHSTNESAQRRAGSCPTTHRPADANSRWIASAAGCCGGIRIPSRRRSSAQTRRSTRTIAARCNRSLQRTRSRSAAPMVRGHVADLVDRVLVPQDNRRGRGVLRRVAVSRDR